MLKIKSEVAGKVSVVGFWGGVTCNSDAGGGGHMLSDTCAYGGKLCHRLFLPKFYISYIFRDCLGIIIRALSYSYSLASTSFDESASVYWGSRQFVKGM